MTTRAQHIQFAKTRALEYVDLGQPQTALDSLTSDLRKHPETADHQGLELMAMLQYRGHLRTTADVRDCINGIS